MGLWVDYAIRTGQPLSLTLHPVIWKRLVGNEEFTMSDLKSFDVNSYQQLRSIVEYATTCADADQFKDYLASVCMNTFTVTYFSAGMQRTDELCPDGFNRAVTLDNYEEFIRLVVKALLTKDAI